MKNDAQTAAEAEIGDRVMKAIEPICNGFVPELRAVGTALFNLTPELEQEDQNVIELCCRVISDKADEIELATARACQAARTSWRETHHPEGGEA